MRRQHVVEIRGHRRGLTAPKRLKWMKAFSLGFYPDPGAGEALECGGNERPMSYQASRRRRFGRARLRLIERPHERNGEITQSRSREISHGESGVVRTPGKAPEFFCRRTPKLRLPGRPTGRT